MGRGTHPTKAGRITTRRRTAERPVPLGLTVNRVIAANAVPHNTKVEWTSALRGTGAP